MISYSIVIPLKDEAGSLFTLYKELNEVFENLNKPYEIIFIDDGSTDDSYQILETLQKKNNNIKIIRLRTNLGKSEALSRGFQMARGETVVMLDSDLQDDPKDIPNLVSKMDEGYDLVSGWRKKRFDTLTKRVSSFLFNKGTAFLSGVKLHDFNCGLKVLRADVAKELYLHGELHRFIPVLAAKRKFKVAEVIVNNRPRKFGTSKYGKLGIARGWKGIIDLLTAIFVTDYSTKPAHFFGGIGILLFTIGFAFDFYVTYIKITTGGTQGKIPLLLAGILFMLLGIQLISTGLIAEMLAHYFTKEKLKEEI